MPSPSWTSTARCRTSSRAWCCSRPSCSTTGCILATRKPRGRETECLITSELNKNQQGGSHEYEEDLDVVVGWSRISRVADVGRRSGRERDQDGARAPRLI